MRCNKAREFLSMEMDGMVPPDSTVELEQHLETCADCQEYRSDLLLGKRLLAATEPELPENFDWKLQLRLSQTLREAAGDAAFPWEEKPSDAWAWLRNFGTAAAVGMAAILTFAIFVGPNDTSDHFVADSVGANPAAAVAEGGNDRLPLSRQIRFNGLQVGGPMQRQAPGMSLTPVTGSRLGLDRGWSGGNLEDLRIINRLRAENRQLTSALLKSQLQLRLRQAQLDTSAQKALDLEK
ncbi:MAG: zf-HC2 domain-containing protein [Gemmatimonadales bacterium]|nr:zf-HC2 domain-containing protein [Gemmatimonadales bacterium]